MPPFRFRFFEKKVTISVLDFGVVVNDAAGLFLVQDNYMKGYFLCMTQLFLLQQQVTSRGHQK